MGNIKFQKELKKSAPFFVENELLKAYILNTNEYKRIINDSGGKMSKTVTVRLTDENYQLFKKIAEEDNRPISNFIETTVKRYIDEKVYVDEFEMAEIKSNKELNSSIKRGVKDAKSKKGRFIG